MGPRSGPEGWLKGGGGGEESESEMGLSVSGSEEGWWDGLGPVGEWAGEAAEVRRDGGGAVGGWAREVLERLRRLGLDGWREAGHHVSRSVVHSPSMIISCRCADLPLDPFRPFPLSPSSSSASKSTPLPS